MKLGSGLGKGKALDRVAAGLLAVGVGLAYARTLAPSITWANSGADSGDLVTAAATLGIAHPPGYPTYVLLARLFMFLPVGDLAFRANLLSAVAALLTILGVYAIVHRLRRQAGWQTTAAASSAALALGLSPVFWSQAVIAEVYSLNALFSAAILLAIVGALDRETARRRGWAPALLIGLALGNHITILPLGAAWLGADALGARGLGRAWRVAGRLAWVGAGLLVYLYLPVRALAHPPVNWGQPSDWAGFWWVVSGQPYRVLAFGLPPVLLYGRVSAWAGLLAQQFGWVGLGLGFFGALYSGGRLRPFIWLSALIGIAYSIFAISYNTADSSAYLIPAYLIFAIWLGLGVAAAIERAGRWQAGAMPLVALLVALALLARAPATASAVDASADTRASAFAVAVLAQAPPQTMVIASSDRDSFPLWYYHYALGQRPDLAVIVEPLLEFGWYRENLRVVYPSLRIPDAPRAEWGQALATANPARGPICRTNPDATPALACQAR